MVHLNESKDPYYLPHLTWPEVKEHLARSTTAILPFGALEQHGLALPLGTDTFGVIAVARAAARETGALVAPVLFPGLSLHHMGFPGTVTLSEDTFSRVVMEAASSLAYLAYRVTKETAASAMLFGIAELRKIYLTAEIDKLDIHAGIGETSSMLYQQPDLVRRERIQKPVMTLDPWRGRLPAQGRGDPALLRFVTLKLPEVHTISSNGCITYGDPARGSSERGKELFDAFVAALAAFIPVCEAATT